VREGCALLQGLAVCGTCGRKLAVFYQGPAKATPGYYCTGSGQLVEGRGTRHLQVGGQAIDAAVADAFLAALTPAALDACLQAADQLEAGHDAALVQYRREVERARYDASRTERRYRAVDPDNRLVARGLEADWEKALTALAAAESELARRERRRPSALTPAERATILALADDLATVWTAQTTTDKDRKQLLHTLLEDVTLAVHRDDPDPHAQVLIRWKGGATSELTVPIRRPQPKIRTDEDTVDLIRRLAVHYPDAQIAGILNRQGRRTARGLSYTASRVQGTRHYWGIPCHHKSTGQQEGELVTVAHAAAELGLAPSTLHRWLNDGFIAGEQDTPGAPWRIRLNNDLRAMFVDDAPDGWLACWRPPSPTAPPARPCCSVSNAASYAPSTSAPDAERACVSNLRPPKTACFDPHNERKEQCGDASKPAPMSASWCGRPQRSSSRRGAAAVATGWGYPDVIGSVSPVGMLHELRERIYAPHGCWRASRSALVEGGPGSRCAVVQCVVGACWSVLLAWLVRSARGCAPGPSAASATAARCHSPSPG
jgi:hypothetical protein